MAILLPPSFDMYRCPSMFGADGRKNWTACGAIFSLRSVI